MYVPVQKTEQFNKKTNQFNLKKYIFQLSDDLYQLCHIEDSIVDSVDDHDKKTKSIDIYERPAVHLEHVWDNSSFKHFHHCEFNVNVLPARKSAFSAISGLFVAIRKLNFRQNADGECIDYITFELHARDKITTRKICGLVSDDEEAILDTKNYLEIPDGFLKIVIHIDHHNLEPNEIVMKLTFTVFQGENIFTFILVFNYILMLFR